MFQYIPIHNHSVCIIRSVADFILTILHTVKGAVLCVVTIDENHHMELDLPSDQCLVLKD